MSEVTPEYWGGAWEIDKQRFSDKLNEAFKASSYEGKLRMYVDARRLGAFFNPRMRNDLGCLIGHFNARKIFQDLIPPDGKLHVTPQGNDSDGTTGLSFLYAVQYDGTLTQGHYAACCYVLNGESIEEALKHANVPYEIVSNAPH